MQGWRDSMEDDIEIRLSLSNAHKKTSLFAVYDGHNGHQCADYLRKELADALGELKDPTDATQLTQVFHNLDARYINPKNRYQCEAGSTAVVALVEPLPPPLPSLDRVSRSQTPSPKGNSEAKGYSPGFSDLSESTIGELASRRHTRGGYRVTLANVGDSRAIVLRADGHCEAVTLDHKPDVPSEKCRIEQAGGKVLKRRVDGDLSLSRAFGDYRHKQNKTVPCEKQAIICTPDISKTTISQGDTLILACDGIYEKMNTHQVGSFIDEAINRLRYGTGRRDIALVAASLLDYSLYRGSTDNMSLIIIHAGLLPKVKKWRKKQMRFFAGRYVEWKEKERFEKAYRNYAFSCGFSGKRLTSLIPPVSEELKVLMATFFTDQENPLGVLMLILDYLNDAYVHTASTIGLTMPSLRNHISIGCEPAGIGSNCCSIT